MEGTETRNNKRKAGSRSPVDEGGGKRTGSIRPSAFSPSVRGRSTRNYGEDEPETGVHSDDDDDDEDDEDDEDDDGEEEEDSEEVDYLEDEMPDGYFDEDMDLEPPELEVEEKEYEFGAEGTKLSFKAFLCDEEEEFQDWMSTIHVEASFDGKVIGSGLGRYVKKGRIQSNFRRDMEEPSQDLSDIAFNLFDRYGRLKSDLKNHAIRKGTGAWGNELDIGSLFIIEYIRIDSDWRRKGVGKRIATDLIEKACAGDRNPSFSLIFSVPLNSELDSVTNGKTKLEAHQIELRASKDVNSFWRSLGFRRIGASEFFGLAVDSTHPSRRIAPNDDFDPADPEPDLDEEPDPENQTLEDIFASPGQKPWRLKLLQERLPLHHAAKTLPDEECVEFFRNFKVTGSPVDQWSKVDRLSNNILHTTVCELKGKSARWLLENMNEGQILSSARNTDGFTPEEKLEDHLESIRTKKHHGAMCIEMSDRFQGFTQDAVECLAVFKAGTSLSPIQYARLKFGCTCGACIAGFLSPRMKFALICQAELTYDMLDDFADHAEDFIAEYIIKYVAPALQRNFTTNKSLRRGFKNMFLHIANTLRHDRVPNDANILHTWKSASEWPPCTRNFLEKGGKVESASRIVFERARDQDEWAGDGEHMSIFGDEVDALPECRNDHEFGFVALACGIPPIENYVPIRGALVDSW
ncbi:hypothetical protein TWF281_006646 [Arthrobotrys megalospora]